MLQECLDRDCDLLPLHINNPERYPFLLESVAYGTSQARYDILFAYPGKTLELDSEYRLFIDGKPEKNNNFLEALDSQWQKEKQLANNPAALPFTGGWFLYLGYELAQQIEPTLKLPTLSRSLPTALATRIPAAVIRDHVAGNTWLIAEHGCEDLLQGMHDDIRVADNTINKETIASPPLTVEEQAPEKYVQAVKRIKQYIVDGDVFQVNLSRPWHSVLPEGLTPDGIYNKLRVTNAAPFAGLSVYKENAVICSSPERLVSVKDGMIQTRPIAGTRPRSTTMDTDQALSSELLAHPKERAEHIMLIDLERNDLGRVCKPGTIDVNEMMVLESYSHVHHIVSNVKGELQGKVTPGDIIRAVFPGGTITGCPKVRCMEIIAELEQTPRGAYTGSMGYLNHDGSMDLNILIRTLVCEADKLTIQAGAGIVADSEPKMELNETRAKARGMLLALGMED